LLGRSEAPTRKPRPRAPPVCRPDCPLLLAVVRAPAILAHQVHLRLLRPRCRGTALLGVVRPCHTGAGRAAAGRREKLRADEPPAGRRRRVARSERERIMTFQWPQALAALAFIPVLLAGYVWMQRRRRRYALRYSSLALVREAVGRGPGVRRHIP